MLFQTKELVQKMLNGDKQALSRLITYADNNHPDLPEILSAIQVQTNRSYRLGVTGPPGAGKSTLVDKLTHHFRKKNKTVGIVAMDPSSFFTGGAVLGDRIRMQDHNADPGVFIRSLASHGAHGGLSRATKDVTTLLDAFGFDVVLIETVGVGQTELDIVSIADTTIVVFVPESGDTIQTMKAGLMEIADIFVVNKSDRDGADRIAMELEALADLHPSSWKVPVIKTVADRDQGIDDVLNVLERHQTFKQTSSKKDGAQEKILSVNPATLERLGDVPCSNETEVISKMDLARRVQKHWANLGYKKRGSYLLKIRQILLEERDKIAALIAKENGKPVVEALGHDIIPVMDLITFCVKNAEKILKPLKINLGKWSFFGRRSRLEYEPLGVVGILAPWNFPLSIPLGETVTALMAGNVVILKPSEQTPLIGQTIAEIIQKAGLPDGVFQHVVGGASVGACLVKSGCDKIVFTGSTATGKEIMGACAQTLTPVTLELGGKDPFIVLADADLDLASSAAVWGAFCNSGQCCSSVERVYAEAPVYEDFLRRVIEKTRALRQGAGLDPATDLGPLISEMQLKKVEAAVNEARKNGAKILTGGERDLRRRGFFYRPTVVTHVDSGMDLMCSETFGPVMPVVPFNTDDEVIALANESAYALNAYLWGRDRKRLHYFASQIVAGTVNINESVFTHALPQTPWGGLKDSGMGRTHGRLGLLDLVYVKHVHENLCLKKKNRFWWYGYSAEKIQLMKSLSEALFGRGLSRVAGFFRFLKLFYKVKVI